ncbi:flagellar basal-body MS-ring/collar protein FliF [Quadrisphaera oryzae]|uniref:flagellar basal-body MS-ring/collar protein FliF n=1 Tax=Quadrisphaera TaxID=317661 RepID=UPI001644EBE0|nr:flagellar basal-body MS-ring/collar protein FliF [Quadrisphaera sp. RL12-1S]MBC3763768.1 flagellar M-ring protein FliF [Quadrisphaera sp. RL12-1S]
MPPQLTDQLKKLGAQVNSLSLGQKVLAVIGIGILLLGGSAFVTYVSKPDLVPVASGVSAADASDMTGALQSAGITGTFQGGQVLVPSADESKAAMAIAAAGLPKEKSGFALLDQQGITASQFQQKVAYQRAVEGDLAKTIEQLDGVRSAVVHIAVPEETVYTESKEPTKASVLIDTGITKATDDQVNSIIQLVSSSVPDLDPKQVTVSDAKGELLSAAGQGAVGQGDEQTTAYETKTQSAIQAMLDKTLGPGKAIASVNATLNFDQTNRVKTTYTPSGALPSSQSTNEEVYNGGASGVGGALGANGVLGVNGTSTTAGAGSTTGQGGYTKKSNVQDNPNNTVVDNTMVAPGAVQRQSVAVMVDQAALAGIGQQNLQAAIAAAAGFDQVRGDVVTITPATFDTTAADAAKQQLAAAAAQQKSDAQWALIKQGAIALGVLLLAIVLLIAWRRAVKKNRREAVDLGELERLYPEVPAPGTPMSALAPAADDGHLLVAPEPEPEALRRQEFGQLVDTQPAEVANLLRGWLAASKKG